MQFLVNFQDPLSFYCMFPYREQKHSPKCSQVLLEGLFCKGTRNLNCTAKETFNRSKLTCKPETGKPLEM